MYSEDHLDWKNWKQTELWHIQMSWKCQKVFHQNHLVMRIECIAYLQLRISGVLLHCILFTKYSENLIDNCVLEDVRGSVNLPLSKKNIFLLLFLIFNFLISAPLHSKFLYPSHSCREPPSFPYALNRVDSGSLRILTFVGNYTESN